MANSIYDSLKNPPAQIGDGFWGEFINRFNQFRSAFNGDPRQKVEELLQNGQMTQAEFNKLSQIANQLIGMMRK